MEYLVRVFPDLAGTLAGKYLRGQLPRDRWGQVMPDGSGPGHDGGDVAGSADSRVGLPAVGGHAGAVHERAETLVADVAPAAVAGCGD